MALGNSTTALSNDHPESALYRYFFRIPDTIAPKNYRFYLVGHISYHFACTTHFMWIFLFLGIGVYPLFGANIISVCIYILLIMMNRRGQHKIAMVIGMLEIVIHQVLATYMVGYESGFIIFILVVSLFPFIMPAWKGPYKGILFAMMVAGYLFVELVARHSTPVYILDGTLINILRITNIFFGFVILALMAAYFHYAVTKTEKKLEDEYEKSEKLILNILPGEIAAEIKEKGYTEARQFDEVTVLFTDIQNFTQFSEKLSPAKLVSEIDNMFKAFDHIISTYGIEKIKTIGDSYMCVSGMPKVTQAHATEMIRAAFEMQEYVQQHAARLVNQGREPFGIRIGIHTGPVVAGVVGVKKYAYDIWGDTVNIASRMQSSGEVGKINISGATYALIKDQFRCTSRGRIQAKHKGEIEMYFVESLSL